MIHAQAEATPAVRRIATYERVSSDDQRERQTILMQTAALARALDADTGCRLVERYVDDGVSGTIPFDERPDGARLLSDAQEGCFDEVWVYDFSRVGRDEIDPLVVRRDLARRDVKLYSTVEGYADSLVYSIHVAVSNEERTRFRRRSADGMDRAAREGRYCGGIVPYGYRPEGVRNSARLVPAEEKPPLAPLSEADAVRHVFHRLAADGWSCRAVADELNSLGIPPKYVLEGRGVRGQRTQGLWGAGRVRSMVTNPIYRGEQQYGRRSRRDREVLSAEVAGLVSDEVWYAAQETLTRNRALPKNTPRCYLLRGAIICGNCGRHFCGTQSHHITWYRCDGTLSRSDLIGERCQAKGIKGAFLEDIVWSDIERFLRDPGDILEELQRERQNDPVRESLERELLLLETAMRGHEDQRERLLDLFQHGNIGRAEFEKRLAPIAEARAQTQRSLSALASSQRQPDGEPLATDLLVELRCRLDEGLSPTERREVVRLLVSGITVHTDVAPDGKKRQRATISYRFPGAVVTCTGRGSWPPPA